MTTQSAEPTAPADGPTSAARGGALALLGGAIAGLNGVLLAIVVTRGLGVTRAGVFFVSVGIFTIASNILELGADTTLVRQIPRLRTIGRSADLRRTVVIATVPVVVGSAISAAAIAYWSPQLAKIFMRQDRAALGAGFLRDVAPWLVVAPLATVLVAGTRGFGGVKAYVLIQNVGTTLARPAAIALLVLLGAASSRSVATAWGAPWALGAAAALAVVLVHLRAPTSIDPAAYGEPRQWSALLREFWAFAGARAFAGAAEITLVWLDVLLVGWLVGPVEAGIYATASRFITTGTLFTQAARVSTAPRLSRLMAAGQRADAARLYHRATKVTVLASWPLYLALGGFAPAVLRLFGHGFAPGATALTVLSAAMLVDMFTGNIQTVLLMSGSSRWNMFNAVVALAVDVVVDLILIPSHGATGAAIGWAAAIVVMNVCAVLEVRYSMRLPVLSRPTAVASAFTILCFGVPMLIVIPVLGRGVAALVVWAACGLVLAAAWLRLDPSRMGLPALAAALGPAAGHRLPRTRRG